MADEIVPSAIVWDQARLDLVKNSVIPQGCPNEQFALFIEKCKRYGMDPLIGEIFLVKRRTNVAPKGQREDWRDTYTTQVAEAGLLRRADEHDDFLGLTGAPVYEHELPTFKIIKGQDVEHVRQPKKGEIIVGAWARAARRGRDPIAIFLPVDAYKQDTYIWKNNTGTMMLKCASVAVIRKLFPKQFEGAYIPEEMRGDEDPVETLTPESFKAAPIPQQQLEEHASPIAPWDGVSPDAERAALEGEFEPGASDEQEPGSDIDDAPPLSPEEEKAMEAEGKLLAATTTDDLREAMKLMRDMPQGPLRQRLAQLYNERTKAIAKGGKP